jgi:hypothetical protein
MILDFSSKEIKAETTQRRKTSTIPYEFKDLKAENEKENATFTEPKIKEKYDNDNDFEQ